MNKTLPKLAVILAILAIICISIFGIYAKRDFKMVDILPKYLLGSEFKSSAILDFSTTDEEWSKENIEKSKQILLNRLYLAKAKQYNVKLNESNGNISVELPDDENLSLIAGILSQKGNFQITDSTTSDVLIGREYFSKANIVYSQNDSGTEIYLQIAFNKEGTKKLEEVSSSYKEGEMFTPEATEPEEGEEATEPEPTQKKVSIKIDDEAYKTTYFGQTITDGKLNILVGTGKTSDELTGYEQEARSIAIILNSGEIPVAYTSSVVDLNSNINTNIIAPAVYIILAIMILVLIIVFKVKGIYAGILHAGYVALLLLIIRLTNVEITIEGIVRNYIVRNRKLCVHIHSSKKRRGRRRGRPSPPCNKKRSN